MVAMSSAFLGRLKAMKRARDEDAGPKGMLHLVDISLVCDTVWRVHSLHHALARLHLHDHAAGYGSLDV